jgi:excisionase family DNA binding protein
MAQKFINLESAAQQIGVSKDHLNQLREEGKVRAYRDGASWKFRVDDIEKLAADGVPPLGPPSSVLDLDVEGDVAAAGPVSSSGVDLDLAEADEEIGAAVSDIDLEDIDEPTVPAGVSGANLGDDMTADLGDEADDLSESILLSETELGEMGDRPPSTIIGKAELDPEGDLGLAEGSKAGPESDVRLASPASDVLASGISDDVFGANLPSPSGSFDRVDVLEVDLEAESSRVLGPEDASKAKAAAEVARAAADTGGLSLAPGSSVTNVGSDVALGGEAGGVSGLTGLSSLELEGSEDEDEQVLGEGSGSDITLSGESSGINIIAPSDSGLALDEVPLDLSGAAMGSSLDLGDVGEEEQDIALEPLDIGQAAPAAPEGSGVEAFQLTPLSEESAEEEKDSSQIIALDDISEEESAAAAAESAGVGADMLGDEFGVVGLAAGGGAVAAVEPMVDTPFSTPVIVFLGMCIFLLAVCGMMVFDLIRNMWSWDQMYSVNSSLLETLYPLIN